MDRREHRGNEAWEVFWGAWVRRVAEPDRPAAAGTERGRAELAGAIGHAQREAIRFLRNRNDWSWLHARVFAGRLADAAEEWAARGAGDPTELFVRLRKLGAEERARSAAEFAWRGACPPPHSPPSCSHRRLRGAGRRIHDHTHDERPHPGGR